MNKRTLRFGITPDYDEYDVRAAWGARAILQNGAIDILYDRRDAVTAEDLTDEESEAFLSWLNEAISSIDTKKLNPAKGFLNEKHKGNFHMLYDTRGSYGYLYIGAWYGAPKKAMVGESA